MSEYDFWRELSIGFQAIHDFGVPVWAEWIPATPHHPFVWGLRGSEHGGIKFAELAKISGGRLRPHAPDKLASWLDHLHKNTGSSKPHTPESLPDGRRIVKPGGRIDNVCAVSSRYCLVLQRVSSGEAFQRLEEQSEAQMIGQSVTEPAKTKAIQSEFPNRARWLADRLTERAWDRNDIARVGGPDVKTVQKILDGRFVRVAGLEKLVLALNHKKGKDIKVVVLTHIPND